MIDLQVAQQIEVDMLRIRLALALAALAWVAVMHKLGARRQSGRARHVSSLVLVTLALASYASYYNFFPVQHGPGFKTTDVYHYYMGSKYFAELGYFDLYPCTVVALIDAGVESQFDLPPIRDQRTLRIADAAEALAAGRSCKDRFSAARWRAFEADVGWFRSRLQQRGWHAILRDHGYNPTPIWNAIGAVATQRIALDSVAFEALLLCDRFLMLLSFGFIAWAFGFEASALAIIVWGTGNHWGYTWIGESLLRNLWLAALLIGISLLKKERFALAGVGLALSFLLRIFPGAILAALLVQGLQSIRKGGRPSDGLSRLFVAAGVFAGVALLATLFASQSGASVFGDFVEKISAFRERPGLNKIGLSTLSWRTVMMATGNLVTNEAGKAILAPVSGWRISAQILGLQLVVLIPALFLFWKAIARVRSFEAACLGFALIPLVSSPANYYYSFVLCGVLLAGERPRLKIYMLLAAAMWIVNALFFYRQPEEYLVASLIAVVCVIAVLAEAAFGKYTQPSLLIED